MKKNFRNTSENLLLSLRLKEKYSEAKEIVKKIYKFFTDVKLDMIDIEWLVTIWCKIKRDMAKSKLSEYDKTLKKLTVVDFLEIKNEFKYQFLLEEIRAYHLFEYKIFRIYFYLNFSVINIILDRLMQES